MKYLDIIAAVLVVIGALNWGLVGVADFNLVEALFGGTMVDRIIYGVVGLAGIYQIFNIKGIQGRWKDGCGGGSCHK